MNNILVVNVNWLGDVIFSSPVFKALRKNFPSAKISCLAVPRVKEVLETISEIDSIIVYDEEYRHRSLLAKWRLIQEIKRQKFDIAFLLHRSLTRALLVYLAKIPQRVGYDTKRRGFLLTHKVISKPQSQHRLDHYLNVIESYGIAVADRTCTLTIDKKAKRFIDGILLERKVSPQESLIVVNTGGNWDLKLWTIKNFVDLIDYLQEGLGARVIVSGAAKDISRVQDIHRQCRHKPVILTGQTNLKQLMALMSRASVVISADSGPLHLANAVGTKVIGLFGPTRPEVTGPRGSGEMVVLQNDVGCNREPCYNLNCPENICMRSITVEDVVHEVRRLKD